jgi:hypothetical protein
MSNYPQPEDSFMAEDPGRNVAPPRRFPANGADGHARCPYGCQVHALAPHSSRLGPTPFYIACEMCQAHGPRAATIATAWERWDRASGGMR